MTTPQDIPGKYAQLVQSYRASIGLPSINIPDAVVEAEKNMIVAREGLQAARVRNAPNRDLERLTLDVSRTTSLFNALLRQHDIMGARGLSTG